jgi:predicted transcriptional regulator
LTIRVYLHASKTHTYTATLHSPCGDVLVASVREPNLSSCRALKARGMTGPVHFYRAGRSEPDYIVHDLEEAATRTIRETQKQSPKLVRYRPPVLFMKEARLPDPASLKERPIMNAAGLV